MSNYSCKTPAVYQLVNPGLCRNPVKNMIDDDRKSGNISPFPLFSKKGIEDKK